MVVTMSINSKTFKGPINCFWRFWKTGKTKQRGEIINSPYRKIWKSRFRYPWCRSTNFRTFPCENAIKHFISVSRKTLTGSVQSRPNKEIAIAFTNEMRFGASDSSENDCFGDFQEVSFVNVLL